MNQSKEMVKIAYAALDEKKAEDISIIDISGVTVIADYFLIASGANPNQVQALVDNVQEKLYKAGYECKQVEGYQGATWIPVSYTHLTLPTTPYV